VFRRTRLGPSASRRQPLCSPLVCCERFGRVHGIPLASRLSQEDRCDLEDRNKENDMIIHKRLQSYLDGRKIPYQIVNHSVAYTAQEAAESLHVPGNLFAKVVVVKAGERFVMLVLPSNWRVDLKHVADILECPHVRLATEEELADLFPDCEIGSMPPFGNLYGMSVYVDGLLTKDEEIFFDAGTHVGAIKLRYRDFVDLVHPQVAEFHREPTKLEY
jgi:Ala-tRNA(Pro) deacylase